MAYLSTEDYESKIYPEIIEQITREDETKLAKATDKAVRLARYYLSKFDLLKLFGDEETEPEVVDEELKDIVLDIACWNLIKLANPNINIELFRTSYDDALKFLKEIQSGKADPGWPYKTDDPETPGDEGSTIQASYNPKRTQHF